jgi:hypothetical protein
MPILKLQDIAWPIAVYPYIDRIQFWRRQPLDRETRAWLRSQCRPRGFSARGQHPARFDSRLKERVELRGLSEDGLDWLASQDDAFFNQIEITIDILFESRPKRNRTFDFFHRHLVRRHHGLRQQIRLYRNVDGKLQRETSPARATIRYDAGRSAPHQLTVYKEELCRVTGEVTPLLHLEWRAKSPKALRSLGICSGADLLNFNHRNFWAHRLLLHDISPERLGRRMRNHRKGTKSRVGTRDDQRIGGDQLRSCETIQQLRDKFGAKYSLGRVVTRIPIDRWLPGTA